MPIQRSVVYTFLKLFNTESLQDDLNPQKRCRASAAAGGSGEVWGQHFGADFFLLFDATTYSNEGTITQHRHYGILHTRSRSSSIFFLYTFKHIYNIICLLRTISSKYQFPIVFSVCRYDLFKYECRKFVLNCSYVILS